MRRIFDALREEGLPAERLANVHAPIGLDIGAITPQEIAVSIVAELIAVKHGKTAESRRRGGEHALGRSPALYWIRLC